MWKELYIFWQYSIFFFLSLKYKKTINLNNYDNLNGFSLHSVYILSIWKMYPKNVFLTYLVKLCSNNKPEALKSLYRSPGNKKKQLVLCKNYVLRHLRITINIINTKFVKDLPMIDAQFRFNQCNSLREEYISVFSPYGSVLILWPVVAAILDFRSA